MTGVDSIINYEKSDREDYYGILGCDESATEEQINTEYKVRALQYHPDKNPDDKEAESKFQLLNEAKETLLDPEKRKNYDKWKNSGISISYKAWTSMKDHVHQSMHWATFKTKDRMLGEGGAEASTSSPAARSSSVSAAARRASEGGANIHWGAKGTMKWDKDASSDVVNKFRNYEI
ncbi:J domain-containing protein [Diaphorina citri]|uniref:J domain-containing protein n=1 Tax=Diaphorina citri TaxID=121845 RepID=A0A1S3D6T6_DIACI|nr:J domain-containing protein [Diaphorina citri]KAI5749301.1 hypothetical protein M8J76_006260 [Diaphorina citri]KAI5756383.1 hypothetical protein M8J77_024642 [Diaphorina citri]